MQCPKCQFDNREGVNFCEKCGANLEQICPNCDATIPPDRIFCGICGHNLTDSSEITSIDYSESQSYTPKFLADKILTSRSSVEGERKLVTVLFADVANYTAMSENLDPEEVHQIMDGCFKILMDEVHRYEGTINQFTGDGIMAIFGAPVAHEDHAQRACYAALSIQKVIGEYGERLKKDSGIEFSMRIGINSGPVAVGSIGNDLRMDYTAVGDTTNLAARMEPPIDCVTRSSKALVMIGKADGLKLVVGDAIGMPTAHIMAAGMGGIRTAGDLVARMQMTRNMKIAEAKQYVADKLEIEVIDLTNEDVMYSLRGDLGIGVVTGDPGRATGMAAKCKIAELLDIEINSVNYFKSLI